MEMIEALNPLKIDQLGARAMVFAEVEVADAIEQEQRRNVPYQSRLFGP